MKVMFYLYSLAQGGAERVVALLASHWAHLGRDVTIVTEVAPEADSYPLHPAVRRLVLHQHEEAANPGSGLLANLTRVRRLRRLIAAKEPDVVIAMMSTANVVLALAGIGLRQAALIGSERVYPPAVPLPPVWSRLRRWFYGRLDVVIVQSEAGAAWVRGNTRARNVQVIPNPVQVPIPLHGPAVSPASVAQTCSRRLLAVGRLERQKGFDLLLHAFSRIAREHGEWSLTILGDGSLRGELTGLIGQLGLEGRAFLVGSVGNMGDWYEAADIFVLSSRFEGFPNVLLEALAYGLPVVSYDCDTGPRDLVRPGWNGLLASPGEVESLAEALNRMMSDPVFRHACAINALETAGQFSIESIAALWDKAARVSMQP